MKQLDSFKEFLEGVIRENSDEFKEVHELTSRYETLKKENARLQAEQSIKENQLKGLQKEIEDQKRKHRGLKIDKTNDYNAQKGLYEKEETRKQEILKNQEEHSGMNLSKILEHGKIVMTIENLEKKLQDREDGKEFYQATKQFYIDKKKKTIEDRALDCITILDNLETTALYFNLFQKKYEEEGEYKILTDWMQKTTEEKMANYKEDMDFKEDLLELQKYK